SITIDLAEIVAPGKVTGIDIEPAQIEIAKSMQSKRNVMNVRFEVGDINKLPFSEESFDAVFVHGVVEYLKDPVHVFKEIYRVLTKDGILGARHADYGGFLLAPENRDVELFMELFGRLMAHKGGDLHCGRNQAAYIRKAGFTHIKQSASYDCWTTTPENTQKIANYMAGYIISPEFSQPIIDLNWADKKTMERISAAWREWGKNRDAFAAEAWGEAVAWKNL
ncbi:MAG: class I SAM-dependent methyltransferase, partial [Spirochaetota bacterium]